MGPRSALFSPFDDPGVVVVDEEHDNSYKQEQEPRYHAREVARKLAEQSGCPCVLASATPSLESFYLAQKGVYQLLRLEERPEGRALPEVHLLDLKGKSRRLRILQPELRQALTSCLETDAQAILFLNRRGHSTFLFCPLCGHAFRCPHCQVALIYHAQGKLLRCHHCDHTMAAPDTCPNCMGATLRFAGFGTQRLARELEELFPAANVSRMDRDTTSLKGAHLRIISDFRAAATDLLVGTQMVSKGLHFPGVTVVGVVAADMSLNTPDFRAAERTFQLLTQVAGRAGRGKESGEVFIQTYHPDHYAIQAASRHDYEAFCEEELKMREEAGYPPFSYLANIIVSAPGAAPAKEDCERLAQRIREKKVEADLEILGPAPAPLAKLKDRYRYHILLRATEPGLIQRVLNGMQEDLVSHGRMHVVVDVDPVSLM
ncbi:MAG: primosomal protein N', partial [Armatimonadetes bacterium]|nr:primosomal protein N' [Armatimonadota bacterium]NIO98652.1 primosomal protein N' [Armatimonadota bacterium]